VTWRFVDGFAAGTAHLQSSIPCQDRCAGVVVTSDDGGEVFIGVVSDGAGSAARAEAGAQAVCDGLLGLVRSAVAKSSDLDEIEDEHVRSWFLEVRETLRAAALQSGEALREFAATALVAVASDHQTLCAQIGDGAIVVRAAAEAPFDVALWPVAGEYVNHTYFLTDDNAGERIGIRRFDGVRDVVAFSDGLQRLALEVSSRSAFAPFFGPLVNAVREGEHDGGALRADLLAYLASGAINARTNDDKALVIGCRIPEAA
jgi:hypothetical protein